MLRKTSIIDNFRTFWRKKRLIFPVDSTEIIVCKLLRGSVFNLILFKGTPNHFFFFSIKFLEFSYIISVVCWEQENEICDISCTTYNGMKQKNETRMKTLMDCQGYESLYCTSSMFRSQFEMFSNVFSWVISYTSIMPCKNQKHVFK